MFNSSSKDDILSLIQKGWRFSRTLFKGPLLRLGVEELWTFERTRRMAMLSVLRFEWEKTRLAEALAGRGAGDDR